MTPSHTEFIDQDLSNVATQSKKVVIGASIRSRTIPVQHSAAPKVNSGASCGEWGSTRALVETGKLLIPFNDEAKDDDASRVQETVPMQAINLRQKPREQLED